MSWSLSFVLNLDLSGNSYFDQKGKEKSRLTPKKERITILFGQKVGFLRRKRTFSPKESNISSEEKSTCERTFRPISLYVLADTTVCIGSHERMCAWTRAIKSDFQAFSVDFMGYFPIVSQVLYWAIFPYDCDVLPLLLKCYLLYRCVLFRFCVILYFLNFARIAYFYGSRIPPWNIARKKGVFWQNDNSVKLICEVTFALLVTTGIVRS